MNSVLYAYRYSDYISYAIALTLVDYSSHGYSSAITTGLVMLMSIYLDERIAL